jgi:hypothetical protein
MRTIVRSLCVAALFIFASVFLATKAEAVPYCVPPPCEQVATWCGQQMLPYQDTNEELCQSCWSNGQVYAFFTRQYTCGGYAGECLSGYTYDPTECSGD